MSLLKPKKSQSELPPRRRRSSVDSSQRSSRSSNQLFKRNRTLTGSVSSHFGSANEAHSDLTSPRAAAHELTRQRRKLLKMLAGSFTGVVFFVLLLWQMIVGVSVHGGDVAIEDSSQYEGSIREYFMHQPLQRFRFLLNEPALHSHLASTHPEVESVELAQPLGPASSRFRLTLRKPVAEWSVGGEVNYVDESGVAFRKNYYSRPSIQVVDNSGIDPNSGVALASSRFLGFVGHVVRLSEALGYKPTGIVIPPSTTRQLEVTYESIGYPVKYNVDRPAAGQVEDMDRAVRYLRASREDPDYLDVRVSGRAFYR